MTTLGVEVESLANRIIGAAIDVHRAMGPGYLESVYEECLAIELAHRAIPFARQHEIRLTYRSLPVGRTQLDFVVADLIVVELKAVECLAPIHTAQVISYLRATKLKLGLLINFNVPLLKDGLERIILNQ